MIHKKVKFNNEIYWYHHDDGMLKDYALLSPLDHYDSKGNLLSKAFTEISFAIIDDGLIIRFDEVIGGISELEDYEEDQPLVENKVFRYEWFLA